MVIYWHKNTYDFTREKRNFVCACGRKFYKQGDLIRHKFSVVVLQLINISCNSYNIHVAHRCVCVCA